MAQELRTNRTHSKVFQSEALPELSFRPVEWVSLIPMANSRKAEARGKFVGFGNSAEWRDFTKRHAVFQDRFRNLQSALDIAFVRVIEKSDVTDRMVFFSGRLCAEDFMEILLLCGNGYGVASLKIVRGMYERAVTARYLHLHPEETRNFLDFHWVQQHKLANAIRRTFVDPVLSEDAIKTVESNYIRVRDQFVVTVCKECKRQDVNYTWSKLDFVSMANAVGSLGSLIVPAYYLPTRQAHSTMGAILSRLKHGEDELMEFDEGPQRETADEALITAHNILLNILDLQKEHFALESLNETLQTCFRDFMETWKERK
jgi:hypothetical protein